MHLSLHMVQQPSSIENKSTQFTQFSQWTIVNKQTSFPLPILSSHAPNPKSEIFFRVFNEHVLLFGVDLLRQNTLQFNHSFRCNFIILESVKSRDDIGRPCIVWLCAYGIHSVTRVCQMCSPMKYLIIHLHTLDLCESLEEIAHQKQKQKITLTNPIRFSTWFFFLSLVISLH